MMDNGAQICIEELFLLETIGVFSSNKFEVPMRPKKKAREQTISSKNNESIEGDTIEVGASQSKPNFDGMPAELRNQIIGELPLSDILTMTLVAKKYRDSAHEVLRSSDERQYDITKRLRANECFNDKSWKFPKSRNWNLSFNRLIKNAEFLSDRQIQSMANCVAMFSSSKCATNVHETRPLFPKAGNKDRAFSIIALNCKLAVFSHQQQELMFASPQTILKFLNTIGDDAVLNPTHDLNPMRHEIENALNEQKPYISPNILTDMQNSSYFGPNRFLRDDSYGTDRETRLADRQKTIASTAEPDAKHPDYRYDSDWQDKWQKIHARDRKKRKAHSMVRTFFTTDTKTTDQQSPYNFSSVPAGAFATVVTTVRNASRS
jgi:hypothetical protein